MESTSYEFSSETFERLCGLVGRWKEVNENVFVDYRGSANGSIVVETWTWPDKGIEALTIYHLHEGDLIATHYCPLGNQPRLALTPNGNSDRITFVFFSATNLPDKNSDHCKSFWIEFNNDGSITRKETYEENGVPETLKGTYRRQAKT